MSAQESGSILGWLRRIYDRSGSSTGTADTGNSTTGTALPAYLGVPFTPVPGSALPAIPADCFGGAWFACSNFAAFGIDAISTQLGQGYAIWSDDGGTTVSRYETTAFFGAGAFTDPPQGATHGRIVFQNRAGSASTFKSNVLWRYQAQSPFMFPIAAPIDASFPAILTKAAITGLKPDNTFGSAGLDSAGNLTVSLAQTLDTGNSATLATANFPTHTASVTTTNGSTTITSVGLFSASDVGGSISGTGIPANAVIISVASANSATFQTPGTQLFPNGTAATASGTITATIRRGFNGTFLQTRLASYVRQLVILGSNAINQLGGLFVFYGSEDGTSNTVVVVKAFTDLRSVDNQDLINAWGYFKVSFVADRALTSDELIFLSTTQRRQNDGQFSVQLTDSQEKQNLLLPQQNTFISGFRPNGKSIDVGATGDRALRQFMSNAYQTPSGSLFVEGIRDDITHDFGIDSVVAEAGKLTNNSTGTGGYTADTTNGGLIFSTGATANSVSCYLSNDQIVYSDDTGHGLMGEQTVFLNQMPTGNAFVEFGLFRSDLKDWFGYGVDATGIYAGMRKNVNPGVFGSYTFKTYQADWNRDPCLAAVDSLFARTVSGLAIPETLTMLRDNLFRIGTELLYARGQRFEVSPPSDTPMTILTHINEYGNQATATSLRAGNLFLGVYLSNGTSGQTLTLTSGSWRGGVFTSQDTDFTEILANKLRDTDEMRIDAEPSTAFTRTVTDGVLNSTTTVTSATAAFKASDIGFVIAGTGIPANTTITAVASATSATMSASALVTTSGVTLTISCGVIFKGVASDGASQSQASWKVAAIYNSVTRNPFRMRFRKNIAWASRLSGWT